MQLLNKFMHNRLRGPLECQQGVSDSSKNSNKKGLFPQLRTVRAERE